ncbi:two-component regulator propeller domain-containing protein [Tunturibacter psychrotolerans]|uniref:Two-component regulator propeller domain-containing protein n=1 Tax=Tunturiibacter psychrotolerans TaxID=3069686 RepID=A0AAU7ZW02_9BACT
MENLRLWPVAQITNGANTSTDVALSCPPSRLGAKLVALCLILACIRPAHPLNPSTLIAQYGHKIWRIGENGLDSSPKAIAQTTDGYIWVGTANGLSRFDGMRFTHWTPPVGERLPGQEVSQLLGGRDGSLYVGTELGLARVTNGHVYQYPEKQRLPGPFLEDSHNDIWMGQADWEPSGQPRMFCKIGDLHISCVSTRDGFGCNRGFSIASERPGSIWVGSEDSICHWQAGTKPQTYHLPNVDYSKSFSYVVALVADQDGTIWAGRRDSGKSGGLLQFSNGIWKSYKASNVDGSKISVNRLLFDHNRSLWIGSETSGLYRLSNGRLDHYDTTDGLSGNNIYSIFEDREHDLWVVTSGGIGEFRDLAVISFTASQGLSSENASAVAARADGSVWAGTFHGIDVYQGQTFSNLKFSNSYTDLLYNDSQGVMWAGAGEKLLSYRGKDFIEATGPKGMKIHYAAAMTQDTRHQLWISDIDQSSREKALYRLEGAHVVAKFKTPENQTLFLAPNLRGGLWAGGYVHGLFWFHDGQFETVKGYDGSVYGLASDPDGALWISSVEHTLYRYQNGTARSLTTKDGMPCDSGFSIVDDRVGSHWFYMACGIVRVSDEELAQWWHNPSHTLKSAVFDLRDGVNPRFGGSSTSVTLTPDGRLWSANGSIIQVIDPRNIPYNSLAPPVHIERIVVDREDVPLRTSLRFPISPRDTEIDYAGLSYVVPEKVKFRYRLVGHDRNWIDAGMRRQAFYNDLRPGHYTFQVIACNNNGVWSSAGALLHFTVPPAWYQTALFRLLCVLLSLAMAYAIYLMKIRQFRAAMKVRFDERLEERTRLARDLHDTLLQTIQGIKMVADQANESIREPTAKDFAQRISDWSERASREGRAALDSLRNSATEGNDLAAALRASFEDCAINRAIAVNISVSGKSKEMHPIARDEIYRVGDEAIRNACLHSNGHRIDIELVYDDNLLLRIRDDGRGIDSTILKSGKAGHYGLTGMRERATHIGAKLVVSGSPEGTEIVLRIPGNAIFKKASASLLTRLLRLIRPTTKRPLSD